MLTIDQKGHIRKRWESGDGYKEIAKAIELTRDRVRDYCRFNSKHWTPPAVTAHCETCRGEIEHDGRVGNQSRCATCRRSPEAAPVFQCTYCNGTFPRPGQRGRVPKFCSDAHRLSWQQEHPEAYSTHRHNCEECGAVFESPSQHQRFCCKKCADSAKRTLMNERRCCVTCDREYTPYYKAQQCCGLECGQKLRVRNNGRGVASCANPGCCKEFAPKTRHGTKQRYCSRECAFAARQRDQALNMAGAKKVWQPDKTDARHHRRAKRFGVVHERIKPLDMYERDGWICGICKEPVDPELRYPHPRCATLDHITSMSKGGPHTKDNVQLAHHVCNILKNDK